MRVSDTRTPALAEVLRAAIENALFDVHTALPGRVEKYDAAKQKMDVKPLLKRIIVLDGGNEITEEIPVIRDVPVIFPRAGGFFISFPIQAGDHVLLIFNERCIDKFVSNSGDDPDLRMHDISDAVAIPGFYPWSKSLSDAHQNHIVIGKDGGTQIHVKDGEIALGSENPSDFVALAGLVKSELQKIQQTFDNHTHITTATVGPSAVPGTIAPPVGKIGLISEVKSGLVKSE